MITPRGRRRGWTRLGTATRRLALTRLFGPYRHAPNKAFEIFDSRLSFFLNNGFTSLLAQAQGTSYRCLPLATPAPVYTRCRPISNWLSLATGAHNWLRRNCRSFGGQVMGVDIRLRVPPLHSRPAIPTTSHSQSRDSADLDEVEARRPPRLDST